MKDKRPLLAITMGDPAGCGPEIVCKVAASGPQREEARLVCVGDAGVLRRACEYVGVDLAVRAIKDVSEARGEAGMLDVFDLANVNLEALELGTVQVQAGQAAYEYVTRAIELAMAGDIDAIVTAPLNKEAMRLAGHNYDGHTELLAVKTATPKVTMMLAAGEFRVTHVSTHCSLREAIDRCRAPRIVEVARLTHAALSRMGFSSPRLAIAGLNPHSSEGGHFGHEEAEQIQPAIDQLRAEGMDLYPWPVPPDTVFVRMNAAHEFDAVVAQYHDQGHIAAKLVDFMGGVNITLGLPIIRTSVDHGTAFDIAGSGEADDTSLRNAIDYAQRMSAGWGGE
jgi:4-phospho-D-threonate 3-dehydrogenase / 4-phospho-D-erythronate 3-dehydrogenase